MIKKILLFCLGLLLMIGVQNMTQAKDLKLEQKWDKVFAKSDEVNHKKVTFHNRYGITLAADMYIPKKYSGKLPAIAVSGPFGAVKEQSSGLYAQEMAKRGFLTIAFDPSYTGESGGEPIYTRIKATVASTMYDMSRVNTYGYFDKTDENARYEMKKSLNAQRIEDYKSGKYKRGGGVVDPLPDDAPYFVKDYYDYYKTKRGYHKRSLNSNDGWNVTGCMSFINQPILAFSNEIRSAVLLIHGEKAHSRYFSEDAFKKLKGDNKELMIIPNASHTDLYDKTDVIPFDKIEKFFKDNLK